MLHGAALADRRQVVAVMAAAICWSSCFLALGTPWVLAIFFTVSALVGGALLWFMRARLLELLTPRPRDLLIGVVLGGVMVALTYPAFGIASELLPELDDAVGLLYAESMVAPWSLSPALLLPLIGAVEELLWRGAVLELLEQRFSRAQAAGLSLVAYALAQSASGSWLVVVLGLGCGLVWLGARLWTDRLIAPLIAHVVWSTVVLGAWPLVG